MSEYKFDGTTMQDRQYRIVARVNGNEIQNEQYQTVGRIDGNEIQNQSYQTIGRVNGTDVEDASYRRLTTLSEIRHVIDGPGGTTLAALWLLFVK